MLKGTVSKMEGSSMEIALETGLNITVGKIEDVQIGVGSKVIIYYNFSGKKVRRILDKVPNTEESEIDVSEPEEEYTEDDEINSELWDKDLEVLVLGLS